MRASRIHHLALQQCKKRKVKDTNRTGEKGAGRRGVAEVRRFPAVHPSSPLPALLCPALHAPHGATVARKKEGVLSEKYTTATRHGGEKRSNECEQHPSSSYLYSIQKGMGRGERRRGGAR